MKKISYSSGFTLVESIMALGLFGLLAVGALLALPKIREVIVKSEQVQIVTGLLNNEIESLRIQSFEDLESLKDSGSVASVTRVVNGISYTVSTALSPFEADFYGENALQAKVSCEWVMPSTGKHIESYWTLFTRNGLSDKNYLD